jgi:hypothetical protein
VLEDLLDFGAAIRGGLIAYLFFAGGLIIFRERLVKADFIGRGVVLMPGERRFYAGKHGGCYGGASKKRPITPGDSAHSIRIFGHQ